MTGILMILVNLLILLLIFAIIFLIIKYAAGLFGAPLSGPLIQIIGLIFLLLFLAAAIGTISGSPHMVFYRG